MVNQKLASNLESTMKILQNNANLQNLHTVMIFHLIQTAIDLMNKIKINKLNTSYDNRLFCLENYSIFCCHFDKT